MTLNHRPVGVLPGQYMPPRARLATWQEVQRDKLLKAPQSLNTAWCALSHGHAKDQMLARLDDTSRVAGVATIAGLGSLGISQAGGSLPLWLGGASWLGAMALTPKILNSAVYVKTGVNLNTHYVSSNGDLRPLFQDPNYMPLDVLPPEKRQALMTRFNISQANPDKEGLLQDKLKQIMVQAHTWWMLVAGVATPVISAVLCDVLEEPLKAQIAKWRCKWALNGFERSQSASKDAATQAFQKLVRATVGEATEITPMSVWWKRFTQDMTKTLALDTLPQKTLLHATPDGHLDAAVKLMEQTFSHPEKRKAFRKVLLRHHDYLEKALKPVEALMQNNRLSRSVLQDAMAGFKQDVLVARTTAEATLAHFEKLMHVPPAQLRKAMETSLLSRVAEKLQQGNVSEATRLASNPTILKRVQQFFVNGQFEPARKAMGASPAELLQASMKSLGLRRQWLMRYPGVVGGGLIAATVLFSLLVLGEDFGPSSTSAQRKDKGAHA